MRPLRLFTAFHGNLDFSAMPESDRSLVIARCYWPLLALPDEYGIKIGFEASARTLEILAGEDPDWIKKFRGLAERGLVEPIASGWAQVVGPLAPVEINRANLRLGNEHYQRLLGLTPDTFFVNEQTFADGLVPLYREAGAERVIMEWNNPASQRTELRGLRCQPARLRMRGGEGPALLWNDSIVFQKVQRVAHGEIPAAELEAYLADLAEDGASEALCVYGGDVEIFDYRPSRRVPSEGRAPGESEIGRLIQTFCTLAADPRYEFVLPREVASREDMLPDVELGSAADPIPCKKQPRYNPTRWAVSGRGGFAMNSRCHALLKTERAVRRFGGAGSKGNRALDLVDLWRSDFRTRATEEKVEEFETRIALASERGSALLEEVAPRLAEGEDLLLANGTSSVWRGWPVTIPLRLPAGHAFDLDVRVRRGDPLGPEQFQLEVQERHRDGSIRAADLVLLPRIEADSVIGLTLVPMSPPEHALDETPDHDLSATATDSVQASFLTHRGAALERLQFPGIAEAPLVGTIPHGSFDRIEYTPDFYSGHVVAVTETGGKITDLSPAPLRLDKAATGPVRITLKSRVETPVGPWKKTYRLYRKLPRLDVVHDLAFHDARLASLRLGLCTLLPDAWGRSHLRYGTANGGAGPEWRRIEPGVRIGQSSAVSPAVSATSCLGATEGWVAFEDDRVGLLVHGDRAEAAVAPMLDFEEVDGRFFCRLSHTAAESDETRASFLRGQRRFGFSFEGYRVEQEGPDVDARQRHHGLIYRTATSVGLTRGV